MTTRGTGDVTDDEVRGHYVRLRADPRFDPSFQQLVDLRGTTDLAITPRFIVALAENPIFTPGVKRAFVGDQDFQYGSARMLAALGKISGQLIWVFRTLAEAEQWLGLVRPARQGAQAGEGRVVGAISGKRDEGP